MVFRMCFSNCVRDLLDNDSQRYTSNRCGWRKPKIFLELTVG